MMNNSQSIHHHHHHTNGDLRTELSPPTTTTTTSLLFISSCHHDLTLSSQAIQNYNSAQQQKKKKPFHSPPLPLPPPLTTTTTNHNNNTSSSLTTTHSRAVHVEPSSHSNPTMHHQKLNSDSSASSVIMMHPINGMNPHHNVQKTPVLNGNSSKTTTTMHPLPYSLDHHHTTGQNSAKKNAVWNGKTSMNAHHHHHSRVHATNHQFVSHHVQTTMNHAQPFYSEKHSTTAGASHGPPIISAHSNGHCTPSMNSHESTSSSSSTTSLSFNNNMLSNHTTTTTITHRNSKVSSNHFKKRQHANTSHSEPQHTSVKKQFGDSKKNRMNSKSNTYDLLLICKSRTIYNDQSFVTHPETNIYNFFKSCTPSFHCNHHHGMESWRSYKLKELWSFYDEPYGMEVSIRLPHSKENVYFVPHLSAIKLVQKLMNQKNQEKKQNEIENPFVTPSSHHHCATNLSTSTATADVTTNGTTTRPNEHSSTITITTTTDVRAATTSTTTSATTTTASKSPTCATKTTTTTTLSDEAADDEEEEKIIFEFYETVSPDLRYPLIDRIEELSKDNSILMEGTTDDFNLDKSWFSIAWYPILCHNNTINWLKGQIITYHKFAPSQFVIDTPILTSSHSKNEFDELIVEKRKLSNQQPDLCYYAPIIGFLPYKLKSETWFYDFVNNHGNNKRGGNQLVAPLYLLQACHRLQRFSQGAQHPDYIHCLKNCPELGLIPLFDAHFQPRHTKQSTKEEESAEHLQ
ncbi:hypothetical protein C9374_006159 [Naegleria lovaniensis]|uniref:Uncharacterized protein n=1 Tax=Naegleria lovaniensis TaxID=51637 RepID=A0AA88GKD8_NAELO|nr:uncharacterized protein C9374_006159 [Naegleria lovaniensis]KAG2381775.1 hypothetical protein C9374_006159 [Naegleria lovaniensis]